MKYTIDYCFLLVNVHRIYKEAITCVNSSRWQENMQVVRENITYELDSLSEK